MVNPNIGKQKKGGGLAFLRVHTHKFKTNKQLTLLGYSFDDGALVLELIALGSHENFYRDIKRTISFFQTIASGSLRQKPSDKFRK